MTRILIAAFTALLAAPTVRGSAPSGYSMAREFRASQDTTKKGKAKKSAKKVGTDGGGDSTTATGDSAASPNGGMPSDEKLAERRRDAEALPLFREHSTLDFTLIGNFKALAKNRDTLSKKLFAGTLIVPGEGGRADTIPVKLRTRGHYRLARCAFVPLRVEFPKDKSKGTVFEGEKTIKLGTHCERSGEYEQYVLREYIANRIHELVSPIGLRVRLSRATYVDSATSKEIDTRYALWFESEEHMAARAGGVVRELRRALFEDVDNTTLLNMTVFNYMIGAHDWSMYALHNVRMVITPTGLLLPVPYDFDFAGLVDTRYAIPDPRLNIRSVRSRLNRGPCGVTREQLEPILAKFRGAKDQILALYDSLPALDKRYAADAKDYLGEFFRTIDRPSDVKAELIDSCTRKESA